MIETPEVSFPRRAIDEPTLITPTATSPAGAAFDAFCREHYAKVTGLAYVLSGSRTAAEDLTQDAFFAAFRQWGRVSAYDNPGAWVRRVVVNKAVSRRRRLVSESRAMMRVGSRRAPFAELDQPDLEFWALVRSLPTRQAQVFALTCLEDFPLARVAEILEISEVTAKTHLQRARATLKQTVRPQTTRAAERGTAEEETS